MASTLEREGHPALPPAERAHGTRARYVFGATGNDWRNGCRCHECSAAAVLYEKRRQRARARGEVAYIDATEARRHLLFLRANGVGRRSVAASSGLSPSHVSKIARGAVTKIRPATAEAILAVHLGRTPPGSYVDATRTLAQIDDLVNVVGMTRTAIAQALGYRTHALQLGKNGRVTKANADRVDALWREWMRPILVEREHVNRKQAEYRARRREAVAS